eukprot:s6426_g3.t1
MLRPFLPPKGCFCGRSFQYPDQQVFQEVTEGIKLTGQTPATGIFPPTFKPALRQEADLPDWAPSARSRVFDKVRPQGAVDSVVHEKTLEERDKGWAKGPVCRDSLQGSSVVSRRFGLRKGEKTRLVDDLSFSGVNELVTVQESPKPHGPDVVAASMLAFMKAAPGVPDLSFSGVNELVTVQESPKPHGPDVVAASMLAFMKAAPGVPLEGRPYDLRSAYRQLPIHPDSLQHAFVAHWNPGPATVEVDQLLALPFGASRSVFGFIRAATSVWWLGCVALGICWSVFFDDFITISKSEDVKHTEAAVCTFCRMLGWLFDDCGSKAVNFSSPIALQDPLGKCIARVVKSRIQAEILEKLAATPQFAYLPARSTASAISRAARFCASVRDKLQSSRIEVRDRKAGKTRSPITGGGLLSIDMSKAFDYVSHSYLASSLRHLGIREDTVQLVLALHHTQYHVTRKGHTGVIHLRNGIRQGCTLSPTLWVCVTHYMLYQLAKRLEQFPSLGSPTQWLERAVTAFADDFLASFDLDCKQDLVHMCVRVGCLFTVLQEAGMHVNPDKSLLLLRSAGSTLAKWVKARTFKRQDRKFIRLGTPFQPIDVALANTVPYLGTVMSFDAFETRTADLRIRQAKTAVARLGRVLFKKQGLSLQHRLRVYRTCIRSTMSHALAVVGTSPQALQRLSSLESRHVRCITGNPRKEDNESIEVIFQRFAYTGIAAFLLDASKRRLDTLTRDRPNYPGLTADIESHHSDASTDSQGVVRTLAEQMETDPPRRLQTDDRRQKWQRPDGKGKGHRPDKRGRDDNQTWSSNKWDALTDQVSGDEVRRLLALMTRLCLRQEDDLASV